jgi:uncharacterized membrane protein
MKRIVVRELPHIVLLGLLIAVTVLAWPRAPERLPVHWNAGGHVDRYGSKDEALLVLPLIATLTYVLLAALGRSPAASSYARMPGVYDLVRGCVLAVLSIVQLASIAPYFGISVDTGAVALVAVAAFLIIAGLLLGRLDVAPLGAAPPAEHPSSMAAIGLAAHRLGSRLLSLTGLSVLAVTVRAGVAVGTWTLIIGTAATAVLSGTYGLALARRRG